MTFNKVTKLTGNFTTKTIEAKRQRKLSLKCGKKITDNLEFHTQEKHPPRNEDETKTFLEKEKQRIYVQQTCTTEDTKGSSSDKRKMTPDVSTEAQKIIKDNGNNNF